MVNCEMMMKSKKLGSVFFYKKHKRENLLDYSRSMFTYSHGLMMICRLSKKIMAYMLSIDPRFSLIKKKTQKFQSKFESENQR